MGSNGTNPPTGGEQNGHAIDNAENETAVDTNGHPDAPIGEAEEEEEARQARLEEMQEGNPAGRLPRFLDEQQGAGRRWKWVPYPVRRFARAAARWSLGPPHPKRYRIDPVLPAVQHAPIWLLDTYLPRRKHRLLLFAAYVSLWLLTFALVKRQEGSVTELKPYGPPQSIGCGAAFWDGGDYCGLNGDRCRPFKGSAFAFRCPADCASRQLGDPRAVGGQEINYRSLVVGGPPNDTDGHSAYRGDSWICAAAIHDGVISNAEGGCGVVRLVGSRPSYASSLRNGLESVAFDSYFPKSFVFEAGLECKAKDLRWHLLAVDAAYTGVLSLFTTSPALFFFTILSAVFWHVGLVSDPPYHTSFLDLFTTVLGKYLPAMFVAWVMYDKMGVRRTLAGLTAQVEKTALWLGACWVGALDNYTLSAHIPIRRLDAHDISQQPGAGAALAAIVAALVAAAAAQAWLFRQEGRLVGRARLYLGLVAAVAACALLRAACDLNLRLHHYLVALLLLPGTAVQARPALLYQGLLVGLFANGVARWGWDPLLETSAALRGDAPLGSALPALDGAPRVRAGASIEFAWAPPPETNIEIDGISVLVNDVERFHGFFEDDDRFGARTYAWSREGGDQDIREYFRFAYISGTRSLDYTKAGVWDGESWEPAKPGASNVLRRGLAGDEAAQLIHT